MDKFVEKALTLLRRDGRMTYSEIAATLGTTRNQVAAKLNPLFTSETIKVVAAVHPRLLGKNISAHIGVRVAGSCASVITALSNLKTAVFLSDTTGQWQITLEINTKDLTELQAELAKIQSLPNVIDTDVVIYEKVYRSFFLAEENNTKQRLNTEEIQIVELLQQDGRISYSEIAAKTGISTSTARNRVLKLISSGAMQVGVLRGRNTAGSELVFGFGITVFDSPENILATLQAHYGLEFLARAIGRYNVIATVAFRTLADYTELLTRLQADPAAQTIETWLHSRIHLEQYTNDSAE